MIVLLQSKQTAFQLTVKGFALEVCGVINGCFRAAHFMIKRLCFHCRMCRNIQFFCTLRPGPFLSGQEKSFADIMPPYILGYVNTGQIQIALFTAKQAGFYRSKAFQGTAIESGLYLSAGERRVFQAGD